MGRGAHHWRLYIIISEWWALNRNNPHFIYIYRNERHIYSYKFKCLYLVPGSTGIEGIPHIPPAWFAMVIIKNLFIGSLNKAEQCY